MKHLLLSLLFPAAAALLLSGAAHKPAKDCSKTSDACSAAPVPRSAFLEAAASFGKTAPDNKPAAAAKKVQPPPAAPALPPAALVEASTIAAVPAAPAAPAAGEPSSAFSNPIWTLFAAGGLGGLYLYLKTGSGRRRRK